MNVCCFSTIAGLIAQLTYKMNVCCFLSAMDLLFLIQVYQLLFYFDSSKLLYYEQINLNMKQLGKIYHNIDLIYDKTNTTCITGIRTGPKNCSTDGDMCTLIPVHYLTVSFF